MDTSTSEQSHLTGISLGAIIVGWLAIEFVAFLVGFGVSATMGQTNEAWAIVVWIGGPLGALIGGYIAGRMAKRSRGLHGFLADSISVGLAFGLAYSQVGSVGPILTPGVLGPWGLSLVAGLLGGSFAPR